ncbi:WhiB family transcriptional regulator [Mycobacterium sp. SM1]|nr:WhiB family transcriptional regulator [Mycobacterium sp. SM1]
MTAQCHLDLPSWSGAALCAQTDPDAFFPEKCGSTREAKRVCIRCPVRLACLEWALDHDERFGVWGGFSERERRRLRSVVGGLDADDRRRWLAEYMWPAADSTAAGAGNLLPAIRGRQDLAAAVAGVPADRHEAYRRGLCRDCMSTRRSPGRTRCETCHESYVCARDVERTGHRRWPRETAGVA